MARHAGMAVEDVFDGRTISTPEGECFGITTPTGIQVPIPDPDQVKRMILEDLTLVRGIGPITAGILKRKGHRTIEDLVSHRRFRDGAKDCVSTVLDGKPDEIVSFIEQRHSPSHPLVILASGLYGFDSCIFLDLETMGFFSRPVILFGFATIEDKRVVVHQILVRGMEEELPALYLTLQNVRFAGSGKEQVIPLPCPRLSFHTMGKHLIFLTLFREQRFTGLKWKNHVAILTYSIRPGVALDACCRTAGSVP
jgi:hypothetical protein